MGRHRILLNMVMIVATMHAAPSNALEAPGAVSTDQMNGIKSGQFGNFEKNWKLVTVRFRRDTGELRFTYANSVAWKVLSSSRPNQPTVYPLGAVFAKVGLATKEDPAFISSAVPSGARRVQFMVRNEKKYRDTDGWGYALFDGTGKTFPGDVTKASLACAACHRIVPDRGFVFSQIMGHETLTQISGSVVKKVEFKDVDSTQLPERVALHLPVRVSTVRKWTGDMTRHVFPGTLDEVRPTLTQEAMSSSRPALLLSDDRLSFSLVYSTGRAGGCGANKVEFIGITSIDGGEKTQSVSYCEGGR